VSGIEPQHLQDATEFAVVQHEVAVAPVHLRVV
jgi:hypothetical protein